MTLKFRYSARLSMVALGSFSLNAMAIAGDTPPAGGGFDRELEMQGIKFHLTCPNNGSINRLTVVPAGLSEDNKKIVVEVDGTVTGAAVEDLNADGSPEVYIYTQSAGSGSYGSVIAFAANKKKSLSQVTLPDLADDKKASSGYAGHDEFELVENRLVRRFMLHRDGDTNAAPTGKTRQVQYRLEAAEAGWILRADKVLDY